MFVDRMLNQGPSPVLEQMLQFTDSRAELLGEDVVNASTPGYIQKDMSVGEFQKALAAKVDEAETAGPGSVDFTDISMDETNPKSLLFQDGNNRSMEQLMTDQAKNALMHNLAVELLRRQYATLSMAIMEKPQ
jgi:flagellar basal-body rod protein FlgB